MQAEHDLPLGQRIRDMQGHSARLRGEAGQLQDDVNRLRRQADENDRQIENLRRSGR